VTSRFDLFLNIDLIIKRLKMKDVYVSEVGMAKFGKRELVMDELVGEAVKNMIGESEQLESENIDAIFFGTMSAEEFIGISNISTWVTDCLGLVGKPAVRIETGSSSGAAVSGVPGGCSRCRLRVL
jgi:acetyl-CoA C-acetyltransferase